MGAPKHGSINIDIAAQELLGRAINITQQHIDVTQRQQAILSDLKRFYSSRTEDFGWTWKNLEFEFHRSMWDLGKLIGGPIGAEICKLVEIPMMEKFKQSRPRRSDLVSYDLATIKEMYGPAIAEILGRPPTEWTHPACATELERLARKYENEFI